MSLVRRCPFSHFHMIVVDHDIGSSVTLMHKVNLFQLVQIFIHCKITELIFKTSNQSQYEETKLENLFHSLQNFTFPKHKRVHFILVPIHSFTSQREMDISCNDIKYFHDFFMPRQFIPKSASIPTRPSNRGEKHLQMFSPRFPAFPLST